MEHLRDVQDGESNIHLETLVKQTNPKKKTRGSSSSKEGRVQRVKKEDGAEVKKEEVETIKIRIIKDVKIPKFKETIFKPPKLRKPFYKMNKIEMQNEYMRRYNLTKDQLLRYVKKKTLNNLEIGSWLGLTEDDFLMDPLVVDQIYRVGLEFDVTNTKRYNKVKANHRKYGIISTPRVLKTTPETSTEDWGNSGKEEFRKWTCHTLEKKGSTSSFRRKGKQKLNIKKIFGMFYIWIPNQ
jgi:hypothetical protein